MTISEKIFTLLDQKGMTQKEFSIKTGIAESTISDWKKKNNNPTAEKLLAICKVLDIKLEDLLSGTEDVSEKAKPVDYVIFSKNSEVGLLVDRYEKLDYEMRNRLLGYLEAMEELTNSKE